MYSSVYMIYLGSMIICVTFVTLPLFKNLISDETFYFVSPYLTSMLISIAINLMQKKENTML
jgi:hypothetical protein